MLDFEWANPHPIVWMVEILKLQAHRETRKSGNWVTMARNESALTPAAIAGRAQEIPIAGNMAASREAFGHISQKRHKINALAQCSESGVH